jgi:hypothetical protein
MCDYSLMCFPNRLANEGEDLVVHRFRSGSMGLASPAELEPERNADPNQKRSIWAAIRDFFTPEDAGTVTAVCIPPSARLAIHDIGREFQARYKVGPEEEVVFEQLSADVNSYRDAVRFQNGSKIRLQELPQGLRVTVVSLADADMEELTTNLELLRRAA